MVGGVSTVAAVRDEQCLAEVSIRRVRGRRDGVDRSKGVSAVTRLGVGASSKTYFSSSRP